jgi:hypothetical protein
MDDDAGRLVEREETRILVEDVEAGGWRLEA